MSFYQQVFTKFTMLINYFQSWNKQQSHVMIEYKLSKEGTKHKWQYSRVSLYLYQRQWQILYLFITIRDAAEKKCMYKASKYHLPLSLTFNLQQSKKNYWYHCLTLPCSCRSCLSLSTSTVFLCSSCFFSSSKSPIIPSISFVSNEQPSLTFCNVKQHRC